MEKTMDRFKASSGFRFSLFGSPTGLFRKSIACGLLLMAGVLAVGGCAAITNPVGDAVRVRKLPPELLAPSKAGEQTIPLTLLEQPQPKSYLLAPGDVLGVYIEGFLGDRNVQGGIPIQAGQPLLIAGQRRLDPSVGYPVAVQPDGMISLPSVPPLKAEGLSLAEAREAIRKVYLEKGFIRPETERILVTLMHGRQYQVIVLRQEASAFAVGPESYLISSAKRGSGFVLELQAYENDVLHALAMTGGLPGLDAYNEVIIMRNAFRGERDRDMLLKTLQTIPANSNPALALGLTGEIIRIPLRHGPCERLPISLDDIILHNGDVVFLEARENQWYYTGGLLPAGKHILPRDHDLDVVEAVAEVRGPLFNGDFGVNNLSGDLVKPGIGNPSSSFLAVIRRTPCGGQIPIRVDLRRAMRDPRERILVQAGDILILQETPGEALARYITQTFLNFDIFWEVFHSKHGIGALDIAAPERLNERVGTFQSFTPVP
jgi:Polysaccharide biosynthesis/export protein